METRAVMYIVQRLVPGEGGNLSAWEDTYWTEKAGAHDEGDNTPPKAVSLADAVKALDKATQTWSDSLYRIYPVEEIQ